MREVDLSNAHWRKRSYSYEHGGDSVEVTEGTHGIVPVRGSKIPDGHVLFIGTPAWTHFINGVDPGRISDADHNPTDAQEGDDGLDAFRPDAAAGGGGRGCRRHGPRELSITARDRSRRPVARNSGAAGDRRGPAVAIRSATTTRRQPARVEGRACSRPSNRPPRPQDTVRGGASAHPARPGRRERRRSRPPARRRWRGSAAG
ncbi:DUF397 domain-containing protein [Streptomyces sp. G45]|uniref:DUF397 domain-containing protein n=1 Tax=Streptomyces sp. G45 TaxID=3406627 RepID=UPI003C1941C0